ncbi:MAG: fimbrillin family protein [Bacteroidales bacterium]|jgi:hypothetical protein|nr:fimbrillin family protein [Bacteroidales bacterium]
MRNVIILLILIPFFLSCERDNGSVNVVPLSVEAGISIQSATKAIISGTSFPDNSKIGVQVLRASDGEVYEPGALTNVEFTYNEASSTWTSAKFSLTSTLGNVYAYYPFLHIGLDNEVFTNVNISINSISDFDSDIDYMFAIPLTDPSEQVSNASGKNLANLVMQHALTQISFVVYKENYLGTGSFTRFCIEDAGATEWVKVSKAADDDLLMNIQNGSITGGIKGAIIRNFVTPVTLSSDPPSEILQTLRSQVNASAILMPTGLIEAGDIKFTFTVDGKICSAVNSSSITWEAGKQYIYKVKFSGTDISISSVTVTDWDTQLADDIIIN